MITATYAIAGILLALDRLALHAGLLTAQTQTLAGTLIFFVARPRQLRLPDGKRDLSAGNSRPGDLRLFYAIGTLVGGVGGTILCRVDHWHRSKRAVRRIPRGGALMILGAIVEAWIGVPAEGAR